MRVEQGTQDHRPKLKAEDTRHVLGGCGRLVIGNDGEMRLCTAKDSCWKQILLEQGDTNIYPSQKCPAGF